MKKLVFFAVLAFIGIACHVTPNMTNVPKGAKFCGSDPECPQGYYCGFYGVDSPAVCKPR